MSYFNTWKESMFNPMNFFAKLPKKLTYKEPTIFYLKTVTISLLLNIVVLGLFFMPFLFASAFGGLFAAMGMGIVILLILIMIPIIILISWGMLWVSAGVLHLFVMLMGTKKSYLETFKVVSYSYAPTIFSFIPGVSYLAMIYSVVLQVIGIHKLHKMEIWKAVVAVLLPIFLVFIVVMSFIMAVFASLMFTAGI